MDNAEREKIITEDMLKIIDKKFMQMVQDFLAKTLNLSLLTVFNGDWLTCPSVSNEFFWELTLKEQKATNSNIQNHFELEAMKKASPVIITGNMGVIEFCIPVFFKDKYLGCVIGGYFLVEEFKKNKLKKIAKKLNIEENQYINEIKNLPPVSMEKAKGIIDLLYITINALIDVFYADKMLNEMGLNYKVSNAALLGEWFLRKYNNEKRTITGREYDVLKLIALGKNNSEIAKELCISVHTAKAHVSSIIEKFSVEDRVQVAVQAVREGLI